MKSLNNKNDKDENLKFVKQFIHIQHSFTNVIQICLETQRIPFTYRLNILVSITVSPQVHVYIYI